MSKCHIVEHFMPRLICIVSGLISGILVSVFGVCSMTIAGALLMTVGMVTSGFVASPYILYITYGVIAGMCNIRTTVIVLHV